MDVKEIPPAEQEEWFGHGRELREMALSSAVELRTSAGERMGTAFLIRDVISDAKEIEAYLRGTKS